MKTRRGPRTLSSSAALVLLFALTVVASTSCIGSRTVLGGGATAPSLSPSPSPDSYTPLKQGLAAAGFVVREKAQGNSGQLFGVPRRTLSLDKAEVSVYEYSSGQALSDLRASISGDGYSVPTASGGVAMVEWVATPHFFTTGTLLVLYVGENHRVLDALQRLLGPQFAGG